MNITTKHSAKKGFTLIELMISVSIFAIVLLVAMGSILTIVDSNRKARTLTEVMNNLNFTLESMTRTIKTGADPQYDAGEGILSIVGIDLSANSFARQTIYYRRNVVDGIGYIEKRVGTGSWSPITSDQINVTGLVMGVSPSNATGGVDDFNQPRTLLTVEGEVRINEKISSTFAIQTTVSQRKLNLGDSEQ